MARFRAVQVILALHAADHDRVETLSKRLLGAKSRHIGHYYLALSRFARGRDMEASDAINAFLECESSSIDGLLLRSEISRVGGDRETAWAAVETASALTMRPKPLLQGSFLVQDISDLERLRRLHSELVAKLPSARRTAAVDDYLVLGALRAGDYDLAIATLRQALLRALQHHHLQPKPTRRRGLSSRQGTRALLDMKACLEEAGIRFFLVSGTLLGCAREGRLLGHDKDIDLGVWEDVEAARLCGIIRRSGHFLLQAQHSPDTVRVSHLNGVAIDIFRHLQRPDGIWHGGNKVRWRNSPFHLVQMNFLGHAFAVPEDVDRYLTENYGDWRTPMIDFDCAYDTPNVEVIEAREMVVHAMRGVLGHPSPRRMDIYLRTLEAADMGELVRLCRSNSAFMASGT